MSGSEENYFRGQIGAPYHLSVGAVVIRDGKICVHHFAETPLKKYTDIYALMRETIELDETIEQALHRGLMEEWGMEARVKEFIGTIVSQFTEEGRTIEKTTLYFLCDFQSQDDALRRPDDFEIISNIEWHEPDFLITKMEEQFQRIGRSDINESPMIRRVKNLVTS